MGASSYDAKSAVTYGGRSTRRRYGTRGEQLGRSHPGDDSRPDEARHCGESRWPTLPRWREDSAQLVPRTMSPPSKSAPRSAAQRLWSSRLPSGVHLRLTVTLIHKGGTAFNVVREPH